MNSSGASHQGARDSHVNSWADFITQIKQAQQKIANWRSVTPQNVMLTQNVITSTQKFNKVVNAKCNNFPTQNVITFLTQNVITAELQVCSKQKVWQAYTDSPREFDSDAF